MLSVRQKLIGIVAICVLPAGVSAVLRASEAQDDLYSHIRHRVANANQAFVDEVEEDQGSSLLAVKLAAADSAVAAAIARRDAATAMKILGDLYIDSIAVVADPDGKVLGATDPTREPVAFEGPDFAPLKDGKEVSGLFPLALSGVAGYSLFVAAPVFQGDKQVGSIALLTPIDADYLEHVEKKAGSDLAFKVNDKLYAACADHPDPLLEAHGGGVVMREKDGHVYALSTFEPEIFQRSGQEVEVTASSDVTLLRAEARRDLAKSLGVLGAIMIVALGIAAWVSRGIGRAVRKIGSAAEEVKHGRYVKVDGVATGDELEGLAGNFNHMVEGLQRADQMKATFGKYVARQVLERILESKPELGKGEIVPVTVLFSDIRGFTSISERMEPKQLVEFLNEYFTGMVDAVLKHDGVVDKFIGDALMAVFGAVEQKAEDPINAVRAAIEMQKKLKEMNESFKKKGLPEIRCGIGIHTGTVVAGNIGHHDRMEYAVIGDAVNLASRLESVTKDLKVDILLSEDTYSAIKEVIDAEPLQKIKVKGREQEVLVYKLVALTGGHRRIQVA